jgi:hypothetical protein
MLWIRGFALAALVGAVPVGDALAQDNPVKGIGDLQDAGKAVQDKAGDVVECTPERAAQDAALKEKTGVSTGCTAEKATGNELKKNLKLDNPTK